MINMFFKNTLYAIICLICIIFCMFGCTIQTSQNSQISQYSETSVTSINQSNENISNNYNDCIKHVKSHNIDFFDYVVEGEGNIKINGHSASIRFKLADNQVENVRKSLSKQLGDELEISEETLPHNSSNKYMQMVEKEKVIASWNKLENGYDYAKTHSIEMFLTENNGTYFIYFFD